MNMMNTGAVLFSTLWLLFQPAQTTLPTQTAPMRNTFVVAAETVIDNAGDVDIKADDTQFNGQMAQVKTSRDNLDKMADDEREHEVVSATGDLIFAVQACHIQAKDGADTTKCQAQIEGARVRAMEALKMHKSGGNWVAGPPSR